MHNVLEKLAKQIMRYESDTFSASHSKITQEEAEFVVLHLISEFIRPGDNIDGLTISNAFGVARRRRKKKVLPEEKITLTLRQAAEQALGDLQLWVKAHTDNCECLTCKDTIPDLKEALRPTSKLA